MPGLTAAGVLTRSAHLLGAAFPGGDTKRVVGSDTTSEAWPLAVSIAAMACAVWAVAVGKDCAIPFESEAMLTETRLVGRAAMGTLRTTGTIGIIGNAARVNDLVF